MTSPDELLRFIASVVRTARQGRRWSQARLAAEAGVSLAQVGLLEKGGNVTLLFLCKIANALDLRISLSDAAGQAEEESLFELVRRLDLLAILASDLRAFATAAIITPSGTRAEFKEATDVAAFIARVLEGGDDAGIQRLAEAIHNFSTEASAVPPKAPPLGAPRKRARVGGAASGK